MEKCLHLYAEAVRNKPYRPGEHSRSHTECLSCGEEISFNDIGYRRDSSMGYISGELYRPKPSTFFGERLQYKWTTEEIKIMKMRKIILCEGLPASGKSTWAKEKAKLPGWKRVNKDDLREMIDGGKWSKDNEKLILKARDQLISLYLEQGNHVIVDDTNLHSKHKKRMEEIAKAFSDGDESKVQVEVNKEFLKVDVRTCIERDKKRENGVGEHVIMKMYNDYLKPKEEVVVLDQDPNLQEAIICDLDGTLSIIHGRGPYEGHKCATDLVNEPIRTILDTFWNLDHTIILVSGRNGKNQESAEKETREWLLKHNIKFDLLFMRKAKDTRKDAVVKEEIFDEHIRGNYFVEFVLDDRDQVVDLWRKKIGLTCLQVDYGNF